MTGHHKKWIRAVTMTTCLVAALHTVASVPANSERRKPRTEKTDIERRRTRVVKTAMRFLGTPYKSGANNPKKKDSTVRDLLLLFLTWNKSKYPDHQKNNS